MTACRLAIEGPCRAQVPTSWRHRDSMGGSGGAGQVVLLEASLQLRGRGGTRPAPAGSGRSAHRGPRAAVTAREAEASPQPRSPHTAPPQPLRGSPLPAAGRWKPMMRLIRSSEFMSSFLRRSSARRWDAESPAGGPGGVGAAPAPPSAIPGTAGPAPRPAPPGAQARHRPPPSSRRSGRRHFT